MMQHQQRVDPALRAGHHALRGLAGVECSILQFEAIRVHELRAGK
jgi:hypothetical protein